MLVGMDVARQLTVSVDDSVGSGHFGGGVKGAEGKAGRGKESTSEH